MIDSRGRTYTGLVPLYAIVLNPGAPDIMHWESGILCQLDVPLKDDMVS